MVWFPRAADRCGARRGARSQKWPNACKIEQGAIARKACRAPQNQLLPKVAVKQFQGAGAFSRSNSKLELRFVKSQAVSRSQWATKLCTHLRTTSFLKGSTDTLPMLAKCRGARQTREHGAKQQTQRKAAQKNSAGHRKALQGDARCRRALKGIAGRRRALKGIAGRGVTGHQVALEGGAGH